MKNVIKWIIDHKPFFSFQLLYQEPLAVGQIFWKSLGAKDKAPLSKTGASAPKKALFFPSFSALRSHGKSATFRQHYYPEGGWGWVITFCSFLVNIFTTGLQLSFSVLYLEILDHCASELPEKEKQSSSVGKSTKLKHFQSLSIKQSISGGCQRSEIKKSRGHEKRPPLCALVGQ